MYLRRRAFSGYQEDAIRLRNANLGPWRQRSVSFKQYKPAQQLHAVSSVTTRTATGDY